METDNVQVVLTKFITGGKEVAKYDTLTGNCWLEVIKGNSITIKKSFSMQNKIK